MVYYVITQKLLIIYFARSGERSFTDPTYTCSIFVCGVYFYVYLLLNMVWQCTCEGKLFSFIHLTYCDSDTIFDFFSSLFVVMRYDVDGCLNLGPSEIG